MSTGIQHPGSAFSQLDYYALKVAAYILCDAYCHGHTGSRPERAIGTHDGDPQLALIHHKHIKPSCSPILFAWKPVEGGAWIMAQIVFTTCYFSRCTALFSFISQPILTWTLRIPSL